MSLLLEALDLNFCLVKRALGFQVGPVPQTRADVLRSQRKEDPLNKLMEPASFVADTVVLTKRGDVFTVVKVTGVDTECMDTAEVEDLCRRFDAILRQLGTQYRVYQYMIKRREPEIAYNSPTSPTLHRLHGDVLQFRRAKWLETRREHLYSIELYLVVLRERPAVVDMKQSVLAHLSWGRTADIDAGQLKREVAALQSAAASVTAEFTANINPARILAGAEVLKFLRSLVTYTPWKTEVHGSVPLLHVDEQMAVASTKIHRQHMVQDEYLVSVLAMMQTPPHTYANIFRDLRHVEAEYIACSQWKRMPNPDMRRLIDKHRKHHNFLVYGPGGPGKHGTKLADTSKSAAVEELNKALTKMEIDEVPWGKYALTVAVLGKNARELAHANAAISAALSTCDVTLIEESANMMDSWASQVPGNYLQSNRQQYLAGDCHADISWLFAPARATPGLRFATVETRHKTLYDFSLLYDDVPHVLAVGSSGAGKSFLFNFLISSYMAQHAAFVLILDVGGSYRKLTEHYGGKHFEVASVGTEGGVTINPFSLEDTEENKNFLFRFFQVMLESTSDLLTSFERNDLYQAIQDVYCAPDPKNRNLRRLRDSCHSSYQSKFTAWVEAGSYAQYFDNDTDTLTISRFQTFDFVGVDRKSKIMEPLLYYILNRANTYVYAKALAAEWKVVVGDEAWGFFEHPITVSYFNEALRTWRRHKAALVLATQSIAEIESSSLKAVMLEQCMTKLFLAIPGADKERYQEFFNLNEKTAAAILSLKAKQEFLIHRPDSRQICRLMVDPESQELFSR